jgi:hypothetical protein
MSARYSAWIRIGGSLERSRAERLIKAIRADYARLDWGEPPFEPTTADELLAARADDRLRLCDEEARYGEFDAIESACRELGLCYRRHTEAWVGEDAILIDWRPGMAEPLVRTASNEGGDEALVSEKRVREALSLLETGQIAEGIAALRTLCSAVPEVPPFVLVGQVEPGTSEGRSRPKENPDHV